MGPRFHAMGQIVLAMDDGRHAKGNSFPDQPSRGFDQAGYGRFGFSEARVTKWNCVFRVRDEKGIAPGDFTFRMLVAVGTLEEVRTMHRALTERK